MRFDSVKELKGEVTRRLTGIQRNTFEAMAAVLSDAKCKAEGGRWQAHAQRRKSAFDGA